MLYDKSTGLVLTDKIIGLKLGLLLIIMIFYIHYNLISTHFNFIAKCMSILLTLIGYKVTNSRTATGVLNSSKDDGNAQGNCSTFGLTVIPNPCNLNPLSI